MGHAFRPVFASLGQHLLDSIYWGSIYCDYITTLIAGATNVNYGPIIAESNNWTLQALAATCVMGVRFARGRDGRSGKLGTVRWCGIQGLASKELVEYGELGTTFEEGSWWRVVSWVWTQRRPLREDMTVVGRTASEGGNFVGVNSCCGRELVECNELDTALKELVEYGEPGTAMRKGAGRL